jgi:predicted  nucleic acid-binding Zn-ribbon protein
VTYPPARIAVRKCGHELDVGSTKHLPPCPECGNGSWETMSGGDSVNDPYPNRS